LPIKGQRAQAETWKAKLTASAGKRVLGPKAYRSLPLQAPIAFVARAALRHGFGLLATIRQQ
jgi:hypothetical protein